MNKHWESYRIAIVLGYSQELAGKPLLLKTQHILGTEHGKVKLILAWKYAP